MDEQFAVARNQVMDFLTNMPRREDAERFLALARSRLDAESYALVRAAVIQSLGLPANPYL